MANQLYENYANELLTDGAGIVNLDTPGGNGLKTAIMTTGYTRSNAHTHKDNLASELGADASVATTTIENVSGDVNVDGSNVTHGTVAGGSTITQFVLYHDDGVAEASSILIAYFDVDTGGPISLDTNGGDVVIEWGDSIIDLV